MLDGVGVFDVTVLELVGGAPARAGGETLRVANVGGAGLAASAPGMQISSPYKCPIDLSGPVSNRKILKRLHVVFVPFAC